MTLFPYLTVTDCVQSIDFYKNAFGFILTSTAKDEFSDEIIHAEMLYKNVPIMFSSEGSYGSTAKCPKTLGVEASLNLYVYCEDVDQFYKHAIYSGATSLKPPEDSFWGDRWCELEDINGYKWSFATKK